MHKRRPRCFRVCQFNKVADGWGWRRGHCFSTEILTNNNNKTSTKRETTAKDWTLHHIHTVRLPFFSNLIPRVLLPLFSFSFLLVFGVHLKLKPSELWFLASSVKPPQSEEVHFPVGCWQCCRKIKQKEGRGGGGWPASRVHYVLHVSGRCRSFGPHEELHSSSVWFLLLLLQVAKINRKLPPLAVPLNTHTHTRTNTHTVVSSHAHWGNRCEKYTKKCPF